MKSRMSILTFRGRSALDLKSSAVTMGYRSYSSDMSAGNSSVRCCQSLSLAGMVFLPRRVVLLLLEEAHRLCGKHRACWREMTSWATFLLDEQAGCRNSCLNKRETVGESIPHRYTKEGERGKSSLS